MWSARLCADSHSGPLSRLTINVDNLSTFDELSPIVDHKVSIMREGLANLLPGSGIDNNSENLLNPFLPVVRTVLRHALLL